MKSKVPADLSAPSNLSEKARFELAAALNPLAADAFALYVKTKNFHWHVTGCHFRDYHLLFDEQAEQIFAMIDILTERVRKLGQPTLTSIGHISSLTAVRDVDAFLDPESMMKHLLADNLNLSGRMRAAHAVCDAHQDVATASILEIFLDETERRIWFLFETAS